jgi:hypothetical protein
MLSIAKLEFPSKLFLYPMYSNQSVDTRDDSYFYSDCRYYNRLLALPMIHFSLETNLLADYSL